MLTIAATNVDLTTIVVGLVVIGLLVYGLGFAFARGLRRGR